MRTSKLSSILILLGMLILIGILSFPVQAKASFSQNAAAPTKQATRQATKVKRMKPTPAPRTATPKPASTATKPSSVQNTPVPLGSTTAQPGATGAASTATGPTSTGTITPTAVSTLAARQTFTAQASFLTSTSLASLYTPTPTNYGAATSTASTLELTLISASGTPTPMTRNLLAPTDSSPVPSSVAMQVSTSVPSTPAPQNSRQWTNWMFAAGLVVFLALLIMLFLEWRKTRK